MAPLDLLGQLGKRSSCSPKNAESGSSAVAKWVQSPASSSAVVGGGRLTSAPTASGSGSPSRPIPVSSLTWTRGRPQRAARGDQLEELGAPDHDVGVGGERDVELVRGERAHHQDAGHRGSAARSSAASAGGRDREPGRAAGERGARALDRAVAVAVGLDDRAQLRPSPSSAARRGAVALDRADVDAGERPLDGSGAMLSMMAARAVAGATAPARRAAPRSTSVAITDSRRRRASAASTPGARVGEDAAHAAANGSMPRASSAPIVPESTSPVPAVASAGAATGLIASAAAVDDERVVALEDDDRAARPSPPRARRASRCASTSAESRSSSRPSSPACGVSTVGARARPATRARPACAFSPSASISSGASTRSASCARQRERVVVAAQARAEHDRGRALGGLEDRVGVGRRERALGAAEAARHHLGQLHLEDRLQVGRHGDRRVAGAGADRGLGGHADGAREPARAADDEHLAGAELGRLLAAPRREVEHASRRSGRARGSAGASGGIPIGDHRAPRPSCPCRARSSARAWRRGR